MIQLSTIVTSVQYELKNTVGTPITNEKIIEAANRALDELQSRGDWKGAKRWKTISVLDGETDYDLSSDLGIDDYKSLWAVRADNPNEETGLVGLVGEKRFARDQVDRPINPEVTVEERDGREILRFRQPPTSSSQVIHEFDSLTSAGTVAALSSSDAASVALDTDRVYDGTGSVSFNISGNTNLKAGIAVTGISAIDASDYQNIGTARFWLDLQQATAAQIAAITGIVCRIGSSSSNYLQMTATTSLDYGGLTNNWNRISMPFSGGTTVGSPDYSALTYCALYLTYSGAMGNLTGVRFDQLKIYQPKYKKLGYFSGYLVAPTSSSTTFQQYFSATYTAAECLRMSRYRLPVFVNLVMSYLVRQKKKDGDSTWKDYRALFEADFPQLLADEGYPVHVEVDDIEIQGNSFGREDTYLD